MIKQNTNINACIKLIKYIKIYINLIKSFKISFSSDKIKTD
ncbi:hypothetical protein HMPREF1140_1299 [Lachnoanaerobaculum sp. ICM7]|nr:hypothetical protein HMPREF1140_1299 [Lachnoanaerobaculum sp. ICM7]